MVQHRKHYSPAFKAQVVQEVLAEEKTLAQIASQYEIHPNMIEKWKRAALEAMPSAFDEESQLQAQALIAALKAQHEKEKEELHAEIGRLTMQVNWLQKKLQQELPRMARLGLVERNDPDLPLSLQAKLLGVSRSSLYYQPVGPSPEEIALKHRIDAIYTAYPFYGSLRTTPPAPHMTSTMGNPLRHYQQSKPTPSARQQPMAMIIPRANCPSA